MKEIDESTIKELYRLSAQVGREVFGELVENFRYELDSGLRALRSAADNQDLTTMRRVVHALKGSLSTLGAARFAAMCGDLEECRTR